MASVNIVQSVTIPISLTMARFETISQVDLGIDNKFFNCLRKKTTQPLKFERI